MMVQAHTPCESALRVRQCYGATAHVWQGRAVNETAQTHTIMEVWRDARGVMTARAPRRTARASRKSGRMPCRLAVPSKFTIHTPVHTPRGLVIMAAFALIVVALSFVVLVVVAEPLFVLAGVLLGVYLWLLSGFLVVAPAAAERQKLFCIGLSRTGTTSITVALNNLGFACHHQCHALVGHDESGATRLVSLGRMHSTPTQTLLPQLSLRSWLASILMRVSF